MRIFKIKKGDQFTTDDGEYLTAKFYDDYHKDFVFDCIVETCTEHEHDDDCSGNCDFCFYLKEIATEKRLTQADLHRRGIGVNCTIIFDEEEKED